MRILGIDPGFGILGWAIVEGDNEVVAYGAVETPACRGLDERLFILHESLKEIIHRYSPDCVAIEKLFFSNNTKTAMDVAKSIGVVLLTIRLAGLRYTEYGPPQIKRALTGYGGATKKQVQHMVKNLFRLTALPTPDDVADAIAVAACHSFSISHKQAVKTAYN